MLIKKIYKPSNFPSILFNSLGLVAKGSSFNPYMHKKRDHILHKTWIGAQWRNSKRSHKLKWKYQDPLYFNYKFQATTGGIQKLIHQMKIICKNTQIPLRRIAFFIYHMGNQRSHDFEFLKMIEKQVPFNSMRQISGRQAWGAIYGYLRMERADPQIKQVFYDIVKKNIMGIHNQEILLYIDAFSKQVNFPRQEFEYHMEKMFQPRLMQIWDKQIRYRPDMHILLAEACFRMNYFNQEMWQRFWMCVPRIPRYKLQTQTRILQIANALNQNPKFYKFQQMGDVLEQIEARLLKHQIKREWRYNIKERRFKTVNQMIQQRNRYADQDRGKYMEFAWDRSAKMIEYYAEKKETKVVKDQGILSLKDSQRLEKRQEIFEEYKKRLETAKTQDDKDGIIHELKLTGEEIKVFQDMLIQEVLERNKAEYLKELKKGQK